MCDFNLFNEKAKDGMRFIPIVLKAYKILQDIRKKENKKGFYEMNIGDVIYVSLDILDKLLNDDGEFLKKLQDGDMEALLKFKDKSIDSYMLRYKEVLRMSTTLSEMENLFKEEI